MEKKNKESFNIWDYLYYRVTLLYSKIEKEAGFEYNKSTGIYAVTVAIMFNFSSLLLAIIDILTPQKYFSFLKSDYYYIAIILVTILYIIIVYIIMQKRHKMIFEKYEKETAKQRDVRGNWLYFYIIASVIGFFVSAYLARMVFNYVTS